MSTSQPIASSGLQGSRGRDNAPSLCRSPKLGWRATERYNDPRGVL
jgi:hypothetical protein